MNNDKPTYNDLVNRISEIDSQNEILRNQQLLFSSALKSIDEIIVIQENPEQLLEKVNIILGKTLQLDRALIYQISHEKNEVLGLCEWLKHEPSLIKATKDVYSLDLFKNSYIHLIKTQQYIESHYNNVNEHFSAEGSGKILHELMNVKSLLWYPFDFDNDNFYLFALNQVLESRKWTNDEIKFIETVARQVSIVLLKIKLNTERKLVQENNERLRTANERFELAVNGSNDGIWDWNLETNELYLSEKWKQQLGYNDDELKNEFDTFINNLYYEDKSRVIEYISKYFNYEFEKYDIVFRMRHKNGSYRWIRARGAASRNTEGKAFRMTGSHTDITELKENEEQLNNYANKLNKSNADKDRFIQILAHDLKNPFNSLLGFSDLLLKNLHKYDMQKIEYQLKIIHKTTNQTYELLEQILLWTKSQSGKLTLKLQKIEFLSEINEIIKTLESQGNEKYIKLNSFETEKIILTADLNMFKTVMRNLISNAIKFTNQHGQINIYAEKKHTNTIITVSDNGIGIDKNIIPKLWEFGDNYSTEGTNKEKGTGFGLTLCKELIEKHGGQIWVESEVGKGSDFKFTLPLHND